MSCDVDFSVFINETSSLFDSCHQKLISPFIDDEKLQNASDRTLIDLHKNSCLLPSYMMIASMGEVVRLIELKNLKIEQDCEF